MVSFKSFKRRKSVIPWSRTQEEYAGIETSLTQAIQALEIASELALKRNSSEDLTGAAHGWMRMTETIHGLNNTAREIAENESHDRRSEPPAEGVGFRAAAQKTIDGDDPILDKENDE